MSLARVEAADATNLPAQRRRSAQHRRRALALVAVVCCALVVWLAGIIAARAVRAQIDARLIAAGAGANAGLVATEAEQLSLLRAVTFTPGVASALAARDAALLNRLVTPLQANANVPMLDLVLRSGQVIFAVRSQGAPPPVASRRGLRALAETLATAHNARAGRFTTIVILQGAPVLLTIGPLLLNNRPIGAVFSMSPLADVLGQLATEVGVGLTAFDHRGIAEATTQAVDPSPLGRTHADALWNAHKIEISDIGSQRVAVGRLIVDHHTDALLGVSRTDTAGTTELQVDLCAAGAALCAALAALIGSRRRERLRGTADTAVPAVP